MRVAWFSPYNIESAIGRYSKCAIDSLHNEEEIELFVYKDNTRMQTYHSSCVPIHFYSSIDDIRSIYNNYDVFVYNMGDNSEYHSVIYEISKEKSGIIILHDICMHNFIRGHCFTYKKDEQEYEKLLKKYYPKDATEIIEASQDVKKWKKLDLLKYNFLGEITKNALSVVVHSQYHKEQLEKVYDGRINVIPLIYDISDGSGIFPANFAKDKLNVLTVGVINRNKRIHDVIKVIGKNKELSSKVQYTIVGRCTDLEYLKEIRSLIDAFDLEKSIMILDNVSNRELPDYYNYSDLVINLRLPALEGGSASLIEQIMYNKCIVVINDGVYAEIPDNCVIKIDGNDIKDSLEKKLLEILEDRQIINEYEKNIKEFHEANYEHKNYSRKFIRILDDYSFINAGIEAVESVVGDLSVLNVPFYSKKLFGDYIEIFS